MIIRHTQAWRAAGAAVNTWGPRPPRFGVQGSQRQVSLGGLSQRKAKVKEKGGFKSTQVWQREKEQACVLWRQTCGLGLRDSRAIAGHGRDQNTRLCGSSSPEGSWCKRWGSRSRSLREAGKFLTISIFHKCYWDSSHPVAYPTVLRLTTTTTLWTSRAVLWLYKCHPVSQEESTELRNGTAGIIFIVIKIFFQKQTRRTQILPKSQNYRCVISRSFGLWSPSETEWRPEKCLRSLKMLKSQRSPPGRGKGVVCSQPGCPPTAASSVQSRAKGQGPRPGHCLQSKGTAPPLWPALFSHTDVSNTRHTQSFMAAFLDLSWRGEKRVNWTGLN